MKVIVHIGRPKTGTTSLQQFLYANRQALSEAGYLLFDDIGRPNNVDIPAYFSRTFPNGLKQWLWRRGIRDEHDRQDFFQSHRVLEKVEQQVDRGRVTHHTAIITSEHLASSLSRRDEITDFRDWIDRVFDSVRIVCLVRPQVDLAVSSWSTSLRSGYRRRFSTFLEHFVQRRALDYFRFATGWTTVFGSQAVAFHVYQSTTQSDVREFFANRYLQGAQDLVFKTERANSSLGRWQGTFLRLVNRVVPFWLPGHDAPNPRNLALRHQIQRWIAPVDRPLVLGPTDRQRIARHFEHSNAEFSQAFLNDGETL